MKPVATKTEVHLAKGKDLLDELEKEETSGFSLTESQIKESSPAKLDQSKSPEKVEEAGGFTMAEPVTIID